MPAEMVRLASGLMVVTEVMPHIETAAIQVWVRSGSRHEMSEEHGISHVLEHMAFKGTTRRTARQIKDEIASVGGFLSAVTNVDTTAYGARVLKADVPLALDILSDILVHPTFDPDELTREQEVIVQEIASREDTPTSFVFTRLLETAFPDQAIGRSVAGTPESVRSFDGERLRAYRARNYHAPSLVVTAVGAIGHDTIVAEVERCFVDFSPTNVPSPQPGTFSGGTRTVLRDIEQVQLVFALAGRAMIDPLRRSLQIFSHILGGDMSSRLFSEAREARGLCYSIDAAHMDWTDTGLFVVYAASDADKLPELIKVIDEQTQLAVDTITEAEVSRAKAQFKSGMLMAMESADGRAAALGMDVLARGRPVSLQEFATETDAVTVDSVREAGLQVVSGSRPVIVALGPSGGIAVVNSISEMFGHSIS